MDRSTALARLRATVAAGRPIIGGGAGTGLSAKSAEAGGIDLLIIYNSGRYRMAGRGSLAGLLSYGDANQIVLDMAAEAGVLICINTDAHRLDTLRGNMQYGVATARRAGLTKEQVANTRPWRSFAPLRKRAKA